MVTTRDARGTAAMNDLTTELSGPQQRGDTMTPHLSTRSLTVALCATLLLTTAGCGRRGTGPTATPAAAPASAGAAGRAPHAAALTGDASCSGTDVHQKHLSKFSCDTCHPTGATYGFTKPYTFARATTTNGGTLTLKTATAPTTCTVACHYPLGQTARSITWTTPGPLLCTDCHAPTALPTTHPAIDPLATASDCLGCHTTGQHLSGAVALVGHDPAWMDQASSTFHAVAAEQGLAKCQQCHGLDLATGAAKVACGQCHDQNLPAGVTNWKTNCVMCHGGTDNPTGAPPRVTWGRDADAVRIGAHTKHVTGSALAPPFDCGVCHPKPADALSANHIGLPTARMTFSGTAITHVTGTTWDRASATCSNVYCHGASLAGGTKTVPVWTAGAGEAACGTCHGLPPPAPHPAVASDLTGCFACHGMSIDATGALIPPSAGGKHLDGLSESTGGHAPSWTDQASPNFHAFSANANLSACTSCHGPDLLGGTAGVSCTSCHQANWRTTCTNCHGGVDNQTGAPPRATWGNSGDLTRVGAHTAHLTGGGITQPIACQTCHLVPTDALSPAHIDGPTATLTWSGMAVSGGTAPQWNRSNASCASTYCHGNYSGTFNYSTWDYALDQPVPMTVSYAGARAAPVWTGAPMRCDSCHGNPPAGTGNWHASTHGGGSECELCHPDAATTPSGNTITDLSLHINGTVEVSPKWEPHCFYCH